MVFLSTGVMMNRLLVLTLFAALVMQMMVPAAAKETNPAVLADYQKHQSKTHKHKTKHKKKHEKVERVPMAKLYRCQQRRFWVSPNRIREAKVCEVKP
jgi:Ni/Co efflux regulator RcnB